MEKCVRFACGFIFGGLTGVYCALHDLDFAAPTLGFWGIAAGAAVVFGLLAVRYGDDFWKAVLRGWW